MISILIPIYNRDARFLVKELVRQSEKLGIEFEIICLDNRSIFYLDKNIQISSFPNSSYTLLAQNIGQSALRNRLAEMAKFDYLLFIDADLKIDYHNFLRHYIQQIPNVDLVCGGIHYLPWPPTSEYLLHWLYGTRREMKKSIRKDHFLTCNFMIRRELFDQIKFNEEVMEYGHENVYFGIELNKLKIVRKHVFSPAAHAQLDYTDEYLDRERRSIAVVAQYLRERNVKFSHAKGYKYIKSYFVLRQLRLSYLFSRLFLLFESSIEKNLRGAYPSLWMFDFYKVGYLCLFIHNDTDNQS